ncbi:MAG: FlgD immunoglobulin-like domain containing protein [bacterium]
MQRRPRNNSASLALVGLIALTVTLPFAGPATVSATPFVTETARPENIASGEYTSIALDALGNPHIAGYFSAVGDLVYAKKSAAGWTSEQVTFSGNDVGKYTSIALDKSGNVYVAYFDDTADDLRYAKRTSAGWTLESVDALSAVGLYTSIAVDASSLPHLSYYDAASGNLKYAKRNPGFWTIETADANANDVGQWTSITLDEQSKPHIAYYDLTSGNLKYAWKLGSSWVVETADASVNNVGQCTSVELDAAGRPAISHYDLTTGNLLYTRKTSGVWSTETADGSASDVGEFSNLEFAVDGSPVIAYWNDTADEVKYAVKGTTGWTIETVDGGGTTFVGAWLSMVLDAQGNAHMSYQNFNPSSLRYATSAIRVLSPSGGEKWGVGSRQSVSWSGAGAVTISLSTDGGATFRVLTSGVTASPWSFDVPDAETVRASIRVERSSPLSTATSEAFFTIGTSIDATPFVVETIDGSASDAGYDVSLAIDPGGDPHVVYTNFLATLSLIYARKNGGVWTTETAVGSPSEINFVGVSLALDAARNPHVAYQDGSIPALRYARKTGGVWTVEAPMIGTPTGSDPSLVLDAQGNPHISHRSDLFGGDLVYSRKSAGVWINETADGPSGNVIGSKSSIALDAQGYPHVSYLDESASRLRYSRRLSFMWVNEVVDASDNGFAVETSLELDAQGNPHISYSDFLTGDLRYARKAGATWIIETVGDGLTTGGNYYACLALDNEGNPRVTYQSLSGFGELTYARKVEGVWTIEAVDRARPANGYNTSLALDAQGNPHVAYQSQDEFDPKYATASVRVLAPNSGVTWAVGSLQRISWWGVGPVDIALALDGSESAVPVASGIISSPFELRVPHLPTRFARILIERDAPFSSDASDSFFRVDAAIALNKFEATLAGAAGAGAPPSARAADGAGSPIVASPGVRLEWKTAPAPPEIAGYRLERAPNAAAPFAPLHGGVLDGEDYVDALGDESARYRLIAVNGLGDEYVLGEAGLAAALGAGRLLAVSPNPAPGGETRVAFRVPFDGVAIQLDVFDVSGRRVRTLASGASAAGVREVRWDGRDDSGRDVAGGVYLLRFARGQFTEATERIVVVR